MDFLSSSQVDLNEIQDIKFHISLAVAGTPERCNYFFRNYPVNSEKKLAFNYQKSAHEFRKVSNLQVFEDNGFQIQDLDPEKDSLIVENLTNFIKNHKEESINILVDYSSMPKTWYAGIINLLSFEDFPGKKVNVYFSYTPAIYTKPGKAKSIKICNSLLPGNGKMNSEKPTTLIMGLGIEPGRAEYVMKKLNPDSCVLFYSDPAPEGYIETLFANNRTVIDKVDVRNLVNFPLNDVQKAYDLLTDIILEVRLKSNVIIAPIGPKVFTLVSLLLASRYPDIDVWRVSTGVYKCDKKKKAVSEPIIYKVSYIDSSDE